MTCRKIIGFGVAAIIAAVAAFAFPHLPANPEREANRIVEALGIRVGHSVADVGAGDGKIAMTIARLQGPQTRVLATEIDKEKLHKLRSTVEGKEILNFDIILAGEASSNLPAGCCDAIYVRRAYHHISKPGEFNASLASALKPGGRLAVIDFPTAWWNWFLPQPENLPAGRKGHGISASIVERELTAAGLTVERRNESWSTVDYCLIFRKPGP
jgi:SAM-dependent methyltransferase